MFEYEGQICRVRWASFLIHLPVFPNFMPRSMRAQLIIIVPNDVTIKSIARPGKQHPHPYVARKET